MGIFSRFRDIVNSNINSMLEKAEDPEKLIKLMIQEMEDTLVEIKASCAGAMASRTRAARTLAEARERAEAWAGKARLAMAKGREELAREALLEKRNALEVVTSLEKDSEHFGGLIEQYQEDIRQLEEKLSTARQKHRLLVQRHIHAEKRKNARTRIRKSETSDAFARFDAFENRIERMEADADLVNFGRKPSLEDDFDQLETDEALENELNSLKEELRQDTKDVK